MNNFTITLTKGCGKPLYEQLYLYIANEIKCGNIKKNEKLPSKKALASHLHIGQNTVETAYFMLVQEGYVSAKPRSGFYVCDVAGLVPSPPPIPVLPHPEVTPPRFDFRTNAVDVESFPRRTWTKLMHEAACCDSSLLMPGDPRGDIELRESLTKYLHEFRGVNCKPDQIVVGAGIEYLLMLLCILLDPKLRFAVEDPGYGKAVSVLKNSRRQVEFIPLDSGGLSVSALRATGAEVAYITPSHQFPTGSVMPVGHRAELLRWACETPGRYIVEDDYNGEFSFVGKPIPSVQGLDRNDRVIYMSTFSRTLAPTIRVAYMVLPPELSELFDSRFGNYSSTVSRFEQNTLYRFIDGGYLGRHLNRVKTIYRRRKDALIAALRALPCASELRISGDSAGLHLLVEAPDELLQRVFENAGRENIRVYRLADYTFRRQGRDALILGYAALKPEEIAEAVSLIFR